jgi:hypothetical protein
MAVPIRGGARVRSNRKKRRSDECFLATAAFHDLFKSGVGGNFADRPVG